MLETFKKALTIPEIRKKIIVTLFLIAVFRFLAQIPIPGIDRAGLNQLFSSNRLLGFLDIVQGGSLSRFSITAAGLGPYITASIIMQMLTLTVPKLEELTKEGAYGMEKINKYTKFLTIPIALVQSLGIYVLFVSQGDALFNNITIFDTATIIITLVAGSIILMWLGDLITEQNIGNGISILILVSILSALPSSAQSLFVSLQSGEVFNLLVIAGVSIGVIAGIIYISEAVRTIEVKYASSSARNKTTNNFIPLKLNQAGVIPIIFAVSLVLIPSVVGNFLQQSGNSQLVEVGLFLSSTFSTNTFSYNLMYFLLVFFFTFFYTAINSIPEKVSDDLKDRGGFIPGIRPGKATKKYVSKVLGRITFVGAVFLGLVAVMPAIVSTVIGIEAVSIGGMGILIVVAVVIDTMKKIESQVIMYEYESIGMQ